MVAVRAAGRGVAAARERAGAVGEAGVGLVGAELGVGELVGHGAAAARRDEVLALGGQLEAQVARPWAGCLVGPEHALACGASCAGGSALRGSVPRG